MRTTYDRDADAAYINLVDIRPGEAVTQQEIPIDATDSTVVLDFDQNGFLLGIEIIGASTIMPEEMLATMTDATGD